MALKYFLYILMGLGGGMVISGAVFAFIAIIGVVPRIAQKTKTNSYIMLYEEGIIIGGIFGASCLMANWYLPIGRAAVALLMLMVGIFYGCLAVSLAEVLDACADAPRRPETGA